MQNSQLSVGFIGLGNVGGKLAASLFRNGFDLTVYDLNVELVDAFVKQGAKTTTSYRELAQQVDVVITCLPSPQICAEVMETDNGVIAGLSEEKIWLEMSTTDESEVKRLGTLVQNKGACCLEAPVSGGCHRAATGNIAIFAGGERAAFERALPLLTVMGRQVLHTGGLGTASALKVLTNFLCSTHLAALSEAFVVAKKMDLDMNTVYEAIHISSGNSFVHETESQVILNGSRDINFTLGLVCKDVNLFQSLAEKHEIPLEVSPLICDIFGDAKEKYGYAEFSPNVIRRLEDVCQVSVLGTGFPDSITDDESEKKGAEVIVDRNRY